VVYKNNRNNEIKKKTVTFNESPLNFKSEVLVYLTTTKTSSSNNKTERVYPTKAEFLL
jgi:hypothetical protein